MDELVRLIETLCNGENSPELRLRWSTRNGGHYSIRLYEQNRRKVAHGKAAELSDALIQVSKQRRGRRHV